MEKQRTLASSAHFAGTALHTGEKVTLTLHPAPPNHGFKFKRSDLPDDPLIEARVENVKTVERATTLVEGSVKIHTVEHVLSALAGMGVDNALIQIDSNEPPIGDGSAALSPPWTLVTDDTATDEQLEPFRELAEIVVVPAMPLSPMPSEDEPMAVNAAEGSPT